MKPSDSFFGETDGLACDCAVQTPPPGEAPVARAHTALCPDCRPEPDRFAVWPTDLLRPAAPLHERLALRIAGQVGKPPVTPPAPQWSEPAWEQVMPGVECKLLATDTRRHRVSMLVRLVPGTRYPAHVHMGHEELYLLDGELWIDERRLFSGDYHYGPPGAVDMRVWSETGCICFLITNTKDVLR